MSRRNPASSNPSRRCPSSMMTSVASSGRPSAAPINSSRSRRSEEHTSELQSRLHLVCRLLLEKKKQILVFAIVIEGAHLRTLHDSSAAVAEAIAMALEQARRRASAIDFICSHGNSMPDHALD